MDFLLAMRVFIRVVECDGLSAAARSLGLGQPAVSERVRQLESHLGVRLLDRNTRSINVTDVGAVFYEHARQAVMAAEEAASSVASFKGKLRGTLRIAAAHVIGETMLPSLLFELRQQHPELSINLTLNDRFVDPVIEGVDVSIRVGVISDGSFIARRLGYLRRVLLASPTYLAQAEAPITLENLAIHPFAHMDGLTKDKAIRLIGPDRSTVVVPFRSAWRCNHWRPLLDALIGDVGVGAHQLHVCKEAMQDRRLVRILPDYEFPLLPVHAIYPALQKTSSKTTIVVKWLQARLPPLLDVGPYWEQSENEPLPAAWTSPGTADSGHQ